MTSVIEDVRQAIERNDPSAAVAEIESCVSSGVCDTVVVCRAALRVLSACSDPILCQRLSKAITAIKPEPTEAYLLSLVISLCNCKENDRVDVDASRFRELVATSPGRRPAILAVWDAMELFNQGKDRDAIDVLGKVYGSSGNLWARALLMKTYLRTAYNHIAKEHYEQAAEVLKESLKVDSYNVPALHTLAILETQKTSLSSLDEIEQSWRRLVEIWTALDRVYPEGVYRDKLIAKCKYFAARFLKAGNWKRASKELAALTYIDSGAALAKEVLGAISK